MNLPRQTKDRRQALGETQTEFGKRFGVSHAAVSDWEAGKSNIPNKVVELVLTGDEKGPDPKAEVFREVLLVALANGWNECGRPENGWGVGYGQWSVSEHHLCIVHSRRGDEYYHRNQILFSHAFAQALWGKGDFEFPASHCAGCECDDDYNESKGPAYLWHLQQMAAAGDPLKYLADNLLKQDK